MITSSTTPQFPRRRSLREFLAHPNDDCEEAVATEYVWSAAAKIRAGWSEQEAATRRTGLLMPELRMLAWAVPVIRLGS